VCVSVCGVFRYQKFPWPAGLGFLIMYHCGTHTQRVSFAGPGTRDQDTAHTMSKWPVNSRWPLARAIERPSVQTFDEGCHHQRQTNENICSGNGRAASSSSASSSSLAAVTSVYINIKWTVSTTNVGRARQNFIVTVDTHPYTHRPSPTSHQPWQQQWKLIRFYKNEPIIGMVTESTS